MNALSMKKTIMTNENDEVLNAARGLLLNSVTSLIQKDPHVWSARPCSTCQTITGIVGQSFGCVLYAQQRNKNECSCAITKNVKSLVVDREQQLRAAEQMWKLIPGRELWEVLPNNVKLDWAAQVHLVAAMLLGIKSEQ